MRKVQRMKEEGRRKKPAVEGMVNQGRDGSPSGPTSLMGCGQSAIVGIGAIRIFDRGMRGLLFSSHSRKSATRLRFLGA
jgi:hypothetical protein